MIDGTTLCAAPEHRLRAIRVINLSRGYAGQGTDPLADVQELLADCLHALEEIGDDPLAAARSAVRAFVAEIDGFRD